ncbi:hypothetical protein MMA79_23765, partial [Salmonella enterica]|nr:hypothetical protein [Salmonella enterica]
GNVITYSYFLPAENTIIYDWIYYLNAFKLSSFLSHGGLEGQNLGIGGFQVLDSLVELLDVLQEACPLVDGVVKDRLNN